MIATKKTDRQDFIAGLESIGKSIEEELESQLRKKLTTPAEINWNLIEVLVLGRVNDSCLASGRSRDA